MNKKFILLLTLLFIFGNIAQVLASMPEGHYYINKEALKLAPNSPVGKVVSAHFDDFQACQLLTDISVFYYFSEGFTSIGKEYKATHSQNFCRRAVEMAGNDQAKLACAYGVCSHLVDDTYSHNDFVPEVIKRTGLVNGIIHALAEEKEKDYLVQEHPELVQEVRDALSNKAFVQKDFFISVLQDSQGLQGVPLDAMFDAFVSEVTASSKYSVGFRGFTAIPFSIHLVLLLAFVFSLIAMAYLIRKKKRNIFNNISIFLLLAIVILVALTYILFFTGNIWKAFQWASYPFSSIMPTSGLESYESQTLSSMVSFYNTGTTYVNTIRDPAGSEALAKADASGSGIRIIIYLVLLALIGLFLWLNIRKKKK